MTRFVFLIDGLGALLTALCTFLLMQYFRDKVGLPYEVLRILTLTAVAFAAYSLTCHIVFKGPQKTFLHIIMVANVVYAIITLVLLLIYKDRVQPLGLIYFIGEVLIITGLVFWEFRVAQGRA
jgi:phosphatidylserine synthase